MILQAIALLLSLWMACGLRGQAQTESPDSRIAVLENRSDAIDRHLQNTDAIEDRLMTQLNAQSQQLSEMEGEYQVEKWIAWGIISLLSGSSLIVQLRSRPKKESRQC